MGGKSWHFMKSLKDNFKKGKLLKNPITLEIDVIWPRDASLKFKSIVEHFRNFVGSPENSLE